jgi:hypothetical protein
MLVVALSPAMTASAATAVALLSRLVMTAGDFTWAAVTAVIVRRPIRPDVQGTLSDRG